MKTANIPLPSVCTLFLIMFCTSCLFCQVYLSVSGGKLNGVTVTGQRKCVVPITGIPDIGSTGKHIGNTVVAVLCICCCTLFFTPLLSHSSDCFRPPLSHSLNTLLWSALLFSLFSSFFHTSLSSLSSPSDRVRFPRTLMDSNTLTPQFSASNDFIHWPIYGPDRTTYVQISSTTGEAFSFSFPSSQQKTWGGVSQFVSSATDQLLDGQSTSDQSFFAKGTSWILIGGLVALCVCVAVAALLLVRRRGHARRQSNTDKSLIEGAKE